MKQSIFNFAIVIGCLGALVACNSKDTQPASNSKDTQPASNSKDTQPASKLIEGVQEDLQVPLSYDDVCFHSDPDMDIEMNKPSNYKLTITEDEDNDQFNIDLAISVAEGNNIHIVQSKEDFMNNSSVNVESIELQWLEDLTLNDEGTVALVGQTVNEGSIQLTIEFTGFDDYGCKSTLTVTN